MIFAKKKRLTSDQVKFLAFFDLLKQPSFLISVIRYFDFNISSILNTKCIQSIFIIVTYSLNLFYLTSKSVGFVPNMNKNFGHSFIEHFDKDVQAGFCILKKFH